MSDQTFSPIRSGFYHDKDLKEFGITLERKLKFGGVIIEKILVSNGPPAKFEVFSQGMVRDHKLTLQVGERDIIYTIESLDAPTNIWHIACLNKSVSFNEWNDQFPIIVEAIR
jgi:hypothetical protein